MNLFTIISLSWKNVWRNKNRSFVVMTSVILGVWASLFIVGFMNGMMQDFVNIQLDNITSHIQIHTEAFHEERLSSAVIPKADSIIQGIILKPFVAGASKRIVVDGLVSSPTNSFGVTAKGIWPEQEQKITNIHRYMIEGEYLADKPKKGIVIGSKLVKRLNIELGSRIVLNIQDIHGELSAGAFRVSGIFHSPDTGVNESMVFLHHQDLGELLLDSSAVHEIAIMTTDYKNVETWKHKLLENAELRVSSWGDLSPALLYTDEYTSRMLYIFTAIIVIALVFGIVNTMYMAVMERTAELGMLMAVGLAKSSTFLMIMIETILLTLVGAPLGILLGYATVYWTSMVGIDLSAFSQGLELYGMSSIVYPFVSANQYLFNSLIVIIAAFIAAIFPSYKALKLNPVEAIRKR